MSLCADPNTEILRPRLEAFRDSLNTSPEATFRAANIASILTALLDAKPGEAPEAVEKAPVS